MEFCKMCNQPFKNLKALATHVNSKHRITAKEYYDNFLLKTGDNECFVCGKETTFRGLTAGYLTNCSVECRNKNKTIKHNFWLGKKQSSNVIKKRIKNTDQEKKRVGTKKNHVRKIWG